jgi:hypothetical protein
MKNYLLDNSIFNKIIIILAAFACSNTFALDLKLKCTITTKYTYSNGQSEINASTAIVEIYESASLKTIQFTSPDENANNLTVTTGGFSSGSTVYTGSDSSDSNKWDILTTTVDNSKNLKSTNRVYIDRNSGSIIFNRSFTNSDNRTSYTAVSGICEKIDEQKKKF